MTRTRADEELAVDGTLRKITIFFRLLGWIWLMVLAALILRVDPGASAPVVIATMCLATGWTAMTVWAARASNHLAAPWFVVSDFAVALAIGAASTIAAAEDLFHGGYPISTLAVVAYGFGARGAIPASFILVLEQGVTHLVDGRGVIPSIGSLFFVVLAVLLGVGFDALRVLERQKLEVLAAQKERDEANAAEARHKERLELGNRLHDTVLQTLGVIRRDAEDPKQVRYLARRQERLLRRTISEYRSPHDNSALAALEEICDDIEDIYRIEIEVVIRGDAELDQRCEPIMAAVREALVNAAKHSGAGKIDLYAELATDRIQIYVRDRGRGFDLDISARGGGIDHSMIERVHNVGGTVAVSSTPESGTNVAIGWEPPEG